jgi:hypothetical protein
MSQLEMRKVREELVGLFRKLINPPIKEFQPRPKD